MLKDMIEDAGALVALALIGGCAVVWLAILQTGGI